MNFSWEMVLCLMEKGVKKEEIFFRQAEEYSPYYEQAFQNVNRKDIESNTLEVNGFFRFWQIFGRLMNQNQTDDSELKAYLFDVLMHYLVEIDFYRGVSKREVYIMKLWQELSRGNFGVTVAEQFNHLSSDLKHSVSDHLLTQFQTGSSVYLFSNAIRLIFISAIVYKNNLDKKQLLVYLGERESTGVDQKTELIISLFLPMGYNLRIFYEHHFGILGVEETLKLGDIEIF